MRAKIIFALVLNCTTFFAQSNAVDSSRTDVKIIASLKSKFLLTQYDNPAIVMQFNRDTIIIAGYLSDNNIKDSPKNIIYRTTNGCKSWEMIRFQGDAWIYDAHYESDGRIWMGGSDEFMHYSGDYGATWNKKSKPFKSHDRVLSIYMTDHLNGIAGGLSNGLAITADNWETTKQIPSPLDQGKYQVSENSSRNQIEKIQILDSVMIINQSEHIYFSKLNPLNWKAFNIPVTDFSVDEAGKEWHIHSLGNKVYVLSPKLELLRMYSQKEEFIKNKVSTETAINFKSFFSSEIKSMTIKATRRYYRGRNDGNLPHPIYRENILNAAFTSSDSLCTFLSDDPKNDSIKNISFSKNALINLLSKQTPDYSPAANKIRLTNSDFRDYEQLLEELKKERTKAATWGGIPSSAIDLNNPYFTNPHSTADHLNQEMIDSIYNVDTFWTSYFSSTEPYMNLLIINANSDTLKISSSGSRLFSLPWTIEYQGDTINTYDPEITFFIRSILPADFNYYDSLLGGELIYLLIEEKVIAEQEYKNGY